MKTYNIMLNDGSNTFAPLGTFQSPCLPRVDEVLLLNDMQGVPFQCVVIEVSHSAYVLKTGVDPEAMYFPLVTVVPKNIHDVKPFVERLNR